MSGAPTAFGGPPPYGGQPVYSGPPARSGPPAWVWWIGGGCGLLILGGVLLVVLVVFFAAQGPETDVYTANEVPEGFLETMQEVGALEPDEELRYFYSDAFGDIRSGFYLVSDRRVVVCREGSVTSVPFNDIADLQLDREESFFIDSQVTLELTDGRVISFPLSSEHEGDVHFVDYIREHIEAEQPDS